jgi:hypothetical protein
LEQQTDKRAIQISLAVDRFDFEHVISKSAGLRKNFTIARCSKFYRSTVPTCMDLPAQGEVWAGDSDSEGLADDRELVAPHSATCSGPRFLLAVASTSVIHLKNYCDAI